ncbi:hypothetical protein GCM10010124_33520 [Pilimelia terevasa]|uniref:Response regulatory domain-containing protein n=1 Tax=Pilimelia terevasa TaxID=53372 RepID=A0A8J3BUP1_9ACTN|nr:response regulator [Pilimelia terevasa]GGK37994.1 hypothetical protein GCM10010124_33520 [Pilimelia terevasa]
MSKVLVAEDDPDIRDLVVFKLEQAGHEVVEVGDGLGALAAVEGDDLPDLVVLDVAMPGLSGLDVCRQMRADPRTKGLLIILLTAQAQETDVERGFAVGADDYVIKPFSPRELVSRVQSLLARSRT